MTALENILSQQIVQRLGWTLLHFLWQAAATALLLAIVLAALRKSAANLRYIIACLALGLVVLLPIVTMYFVPVSTPQPTAGIGPAPAPVILPTEPTGQIPAAEMTVVEAPPQQQDTDADSVALWKQRIVESVEPALPFIVSGWLLGVFGLSVWHLGGWAQLQRLRSKMVRQVNGSLHTKLSKLSARLGVRRAVQLLESALVQVPTVVGWVRPVILLPASALTGLNTEQLEALLAHELAHIRRYDYLLNMLQTVVETLGFYHPAVWWISHKIRAERENCCDDLAVSISGDRVRYARALTSMEEIRATCGQLAVAASGGSLFGRIRRLIGRDSTDSSRASWIPSVITILLIAIVVIPTTLALTGQNKTQPSAEFLLNRMLEHRSRVRNLQYVTENNIWRDLAAEKDRIEDQIKSMRESGISERQLERFRTAFTEAPESRYQILKCTVDDEEHVKIEQTGGNYDSSGKKMPRDDKNIWAWNGVLATDFSQRSRLPASATIKDTPQVATRLAHPWRSFTGIFCKFLQETIAAEKPVSVEELKDSTYRIAFDYKTSRYAAIVDPSKGYTCVLQETYNKQGQLTSRSTTKYEEVASGIWFPISGQREEYSPDGSVRYKSIAKSRQIRINDPAFNSGYFDVDMPEGTAVTDDVQGKRYVVGSKRVYDLDEPQKSSVEDQQVDPNSWQEKFYSIYRLEDGQVLKRIAPPFIPERRGYLKSIQSGRYSPNTPLHVVSQYFNWDGKLSIKGARVGADIPRLKSILGSVIGLGNRQYDIPTEILSADMSGDWIVRKDTPQEELLQALEQIVKDETSRDIGFVKQKVETDVIIAKGKYDFQLLPSITDGQYVLISTNNADTYTGGGGGSGTLGKFLRWVGNRVGMNIIDETEAEGVELSWRNHDSSELSRLNHDAEPYNQRLDLLLKNLTRQMGLTFSRETATVEKWFISENGTIKAPQKTDAAAVPEGAMPTLATIDAENKTQQEQLNKILEKFSDGTTADKSDNNSTSVRESVENYIAAALAGDDEKAAEYAYPEREAAAQTKDMREALQGQNMKILGVCIGEWNAMAISSVIQADHGRTGSIVFHLKKMILDQKVHWLIDDIDLETLDTIEPGIKRFLERNPQAKTTTFKPQRPIIGPDSPAAEQSDDVDAKASSDNVFRIVNSKANELMRIYFDLNIEAGQYVEIKNSGKRECTLKQVTTDSIGRHVRDFPAFASYIDFEISSNFDLNLATQRFTRGSLFEQDKWDAYFTGPDTIIGNGNFSTTTLCVCTWRPDISKLRQWSTADDDTIVSLVAVTIKPDNEPAIKEQEISENLSDTQWGEAADGPPKLPMMAMSPAPTADDKAHVRVDCLVVEVAGDWKPDSETAIQVENLLGKKTAAGESTIVALLNRAAEATAAEDTSAEGKRLTPEQFRTLIDTLVSKGYLKILMNPTLEVIDGQTAKIRSSQHISSTQDALEDSIQVTPRVAEDGNIDLQVQAVIHQKSPPQGEPQTPAITSTGISTQARVRPGMSLIIGGVRKEQSANADSNAEDSGEGPPELLVILTSTITNAPATSELPRARSDYIVRMYYLQHTGSQQLAELLASLLPDGKRVQISADEQTNRLIVQASKADHEKIEELILQLDVAPAEIQIETRILTVSDEFLEGIGLDANSVSDPNAWPEPAPRVVTHWDNLGTYSLLLNDQHVSFLVKGVQAHRDATMLAAPRVMIRDSEEARFEISTAFQYVSGYSEPNRPGGEPVPKQESGRQGTFLRMTPKLRTDNEDNKYVDLDFESEIRQFRGLEERMYKEKYPYQIPDIVTIARKIRAPIPEGGTLLMSGQRITRKVASKSGTPLLRRLPLIGVVFGGEQMVSDERMLLILVTPTIPAPGQTEKRLAPPRPPGIPAPVPGTYGGYGSGPPPGPAGYGGYGSGPLPGPGAPGYGGYGPVPPAEPNKQ